MEKFRTLERRLKALANARRLHVLSYLNKHGWTSVSDLADSVPIKIKAMSRHLQILESNGMVDRQRKGKVVLYRVSLPQTKLVKQVLSFM